jgi:hypothetical protein
MCASFANLSDELLYVGLNLRKDVMDALAVLACCVQVLFALVPKPLDLAFVLQALALKPDHPNQESNEADSNRP